MFNREAAQSGFILWRATAIKSIQSLQYRLALCSTLWKPAINAVFKENFSSPKRLMLHFTHILDGSSRILSSSDNLPFAIIFTIAFRTLQFSFHIFSQIMRIIRLFAFLSLFYHVRYFFIYKKCLETTHILTITGQQC